MPGTSLAAVFHAPGQPLTLERFPIPELSGSEALVHIRCSTICGSDLHTALGRRPAPTPSILGHEMLGDIAAVGPSGARDFHGNPLQVGDRVTWSMILHRGGQVAMKFGHEPITPARALVGGMAEYCHLPEDTAIFRIPPNLSDLTACPANCATATVAAVLRAAGPLDGESVAIFGAGMLGITACAMARDAGAAHVFAIDPDANRLSLAQQFGASRPLRNATVALEFSGQPEALEQGVDLLAKGGRFILAGATFPARPAQISAERIVRSMLRIEGVYNYQPNDLAAALDFLSRSVGRYPFEQLVPAQFPLSEVNAAIAHAESARPPRVAIVP